MEPSGFVRCSGSPLNGHKAVGIFWIFMVFFLLSPAFSLSADRLSDHWTMNAFMDKHPGERRKLKVFSKRVQEAANPHPLSHDIRSPVRIAIIYPGFENSDYWARSVTAFQKRLQELKIHHILHLWLRRSNTPYVSLEDMDQIREAIQQDVDYLVCTLASPEHHKILDRLLSRSKPRILLQNITTPLRRWDGCQPFFYVGFDHMEGTRILAEHIGSPPRKSYVILNPEEGYLSAVRGDFFIRLAEKQGLRLKDVFYTGIDRERARIASLDALERHPDLTHIYATTTDIALGAADALRKKNMKDRIVLNGWGGGKAELEALKRGDLDFTLMRMNDDNGVAMAEAIALDIQGFGHQVPRIYSGAMHLVEASASPESIKALTRQAFRYSGIPGGSE